MRDFSYRARRGGAALLAIVVTLAVGPDASARAQQNARQALGAIEGRVTDAATGDPLPGAKVMVADSAAETSTDRDGRFRLAAVPSGDHSVVITYLGRADVVAETTVIEGGARKLDVQMGVAAFEETVTVRAELIQAAQERALNQQKTAPNITNVVSADQIGSFPDRNAAETTQRIPGISITKDQGEGRYVNIRGTDPRLNSMMINGERIPAPDPLLRQVAVDVVPSELLQSIEVSKALTPDMDGDSIGGSVNLVMKQAPSKLRLLGSFGDGYNQMLKNFRQNNGSVTAGGRTNDGKLGVIVSASASETNRGNQDVEVVYTPALGLNELNPRYYQVNRKRVGFTGALDFKPDNNSNVTIRGVFNRFIDDHENRQRVRFAVANSRIDRELRDRTHIERITSLSLSGQRIVHGSTTVDYQLLGAYSDQFDPLTMTTTFRETRVTFAPNVSAASIDPNNIQANPAADSAANYNFLQQIRAINFAKDRDVVVSANVRTPLHSSTSSTSFVKFGMKFRDKQKGRDRNEDTYTSPSALKMTDFLETGFNLPPYLDGRYDLTPYLKQDAVAAIPTLAPVTIVRNHARDAEEFDGSERTTAAYAMAEIYAGPKLYVLPGLRYEYSAEDFVGRNVRFAPNGAWLGTDPIGAKANYGSVLPAFHVRYAVAPNTNLRFAVTRSLARPNYYDAVPYRAQDDNAATVTLGNPDLRPTMSWNVDALAEHYFRSVGVVSAGVFYKNLADYVYLFTTQQSFGGVQYQVTQPLNGDVATIRGLEVALQNQLKFLPKSLKGIGVYANYTFTDSTAAIPGHEGAHLPGQSRHVGNLAASYEHGGFSGRVSVNFHGSYVDVVGATNALDRYYDVNRQLDISLVQRLTRNLRVYFDGMNLNNALLRYYQGVPDRPLQEEHYQAWMNFGVKVDFSRRLTLLGVALLLGVSTLVTRTQAQAPSQRPVAGAPQLLVLLVVDQMRGDYIDKFQHQWSHGLRRLVTDGAWFRQAEYPYFNTVTCAGHASIGTGAVPAIHGMILNGWWERSTKKQVACTDDENARTISYGKTIATEGESAVRLRITTLADELRAQLDTAPHIAAFSLKARSAVTLGGQRPDAVAWFDDEGAWVTSTAFSKGPVPEVADFIAHNPVEKDFGKVWDRALPKDAYLYEDPTVGLRPARGGMTSTFPHIVKGPAETPGKVFYDQWQSSPFADEYLARMGVAVNEALSAGGKGTKHAAQETVQSRAGSAAEHTGQRVVPNLLAMSFSSLDKVGHDYGPHSHEVQDILVRLDRTLGELFTALDRQVGPGNYTVALSADHGVPPVPERSLALGIDAGRVSTDSIVARAEQSLAASLGAGKHVSAFVHDYLYFEPGVVDQLRSHPGALRTLLDDLPQVRGVVKAYWRDDLEANHFDADPMGRRAAFSYDNDRSGDVMVVFKPYWIASNGTTSHGSGYSYDTHVPVLLMGKGVVPGEYLQPASPTDIAPTLAFLAGITLPRASGRVLTEALERRASH